ncbi:hypothetical protein FH972_022921 [Carpinus fangiana]|uniref:Uncharacterized protein n=1 Tax=Carpinus fangiana TaxID=176857 RepID=A0A5N6KTN3_9ROSI|nr:hypothetical protein FH972_022921 [Carpinus fangiana]
MTQAPSAMHSRTPSSQQPHSPRDSRRKRSLHNVRDSKEHLRRQRSSAGDRPVHTRGDSTASTRAQQFRVGNVTSNGRIYLRPAGLAPASAPLTPPDSPPAGDQHHQFSEEPWRESFVTQPDSSLLSPAAARPADSLAKPNGAPLLDTLIPHFRLGRPRITDHGSVAMVTDSYITTSSVNADSRSMSLRDYTTMFPAPPRTPESPEFRPRTASSSPEAVKGHSRPGSKADNLLGRNTPDVPRARPAPESTKPGPSIKRMFGSIRRALSARRAPRATAASGPVSAWRGPIEPFSAFGKTISHPLQSCTRLNCACSSPESRSGRNVQSRDQPSRSLPHTPFNELEPTALPRAPMHQIRTSRSAPMLSLKHLPAPDPLRVNSNVTLGSRSIVIVNDTNPNTPIEPRGDGWLLPPSVHAASTARDSQNSQGSRIVPIFLESGDSEDSQLGGEISSAPSRSLRRRPGGNLKLAQNVHDLDRADSPQSHRNTPMIPSRSSSVFGTLPKSQRSFYLVDDTSSHPQSLPDGIQSSPPDASNNRETFLIPSRSSSILRESYRTDPTPNRLEPTATQLSTRASSPMLQSKASGNSLAVPSRSSSINATNAENLPLLSPTVYSKSSGMPPHPLLAKGTYEKELLRLAELPDDNEEDGGIEATLRRLEGRYADNDNSDSADDAHSKPQDKAATLLSGIHTTERAEPSAAAVEHTLDARASRHRRHEGEVFDAQMIPLVRPATAATSFDLRDRSVAGASPTTPSFSVRDRPPTSHSHKRSEASVDGSLPRTPTLPRYPTLPPMMSPHLRQHLRVGSDVVSAAVAKREGGVVPRVFSRRSR